jgi:hypothetical protein
MAMERFTQGKEVEVYFDCKWQTMKYYAPYSGDTHRVSRDGVIYYFGDENIRPINPQLKFQKGDTAFYRREGRNMELPNGSRVKILNTDAKDPNGLTYFVEQHEADGGYWVYEESLLACDCHECPMNVVCDKCAGGTGIDKPADAIHTNANGGHPDYLKLLDDMRELHIRKAGDYGRGQDPFANVRASAEFGMPAWVGVCIRMGDKMQRIKSYLANGSLKNESLEDSFMDLAAYSLIALVLFREESKKSG